MGDHLRINENKNNNLKLALFILSLISVAPFTVISEIIGVNHYVFSIGYRLLVLLISIIILINTNFKKILNQRYVQVFILFFVLYFLRVIYDTIIVHKGLGLSIFKYYTFPFFVIVIPALAFNFKLDKELILKSFKIVISITFFISIYSILKNKYDFVNGYERLFGGSVIHPIKLGHIAVTSIIISFYLFLNSKTKFYRKGLIVFNVLIQIVILVLASSRGPILALIILLFIYFFFNVNKNKYIIITIVFAATFGLLLFIHPTFIERVLFTLQHGESRLILWENALSQFLVNPIFGSSLEVSIFNFYPHNVLIESFMVLGIIGGFLFISMLMIIIKNLLTIFRSKSYALILGLLFIQYFIGAMFTGSLISNDLMWYLSMFILYQTRLRINSNQLIYL